MAGALGSTGWVRFLVYYLAAGAMFWYQRIQDTHTEALACKTSAGVAAALVLMAAERRAVRLVPMAAAARLHLGASIEFFETSGVERTFDMYTASADSASVFSGQVGRVGYRAVFVDESTASFACFKAVFDRKGSLGFATKSAGRSDVTVTANERPP
jgi:hypothetical protein